MISSIVLLILLQTKVIDPNISMSFWKVYIPVCFLEIVIFFNVLLKWEQKNKEDKSVKDND